MRVVEIKVLAGHFIIQMHPYGDTILAVGGVPFRLRRHVGSRTQPEVPLVEQSEAVLQIHNSHMPALLGVGTIFNGTEETIGIAQVLYKISTLVGAWFLKLIISGRSSRIMSMLGCLRAAHAFSAVSILLV